MLEGTLHTRTRQNLRVDENKTHVVTRVAMGRHGGQLRRSRCSVSGVIRAGKTHQNALLNVLRRFVTNQQLISTY